MRQLPFNQNGHEIYDRSKYVAVSESLGEPWCPDLISARCFFCDRYAELDISDTEVKMRTPCPWPNGLVSETPLPVPSGKIIVTDDLRPVYDWAEDEMASYNSALGQKQAISAMAYEGCAYGPVGNTCPSLYQTGDDSYVIASLAYDEDTDGEILPEGWTELAGIITDLWAYSIADYDAWRARGGDEEKLRGMYAVVEVPPGVYVFTYHGGERTFSRDPVGKDPAIFAHVRRQ